MAINTPSLEQRMAIQQQLQCRKINGAIVETHKQETAQSGHLAGDQYSIWRGKTNSNVIEKADNNQYGG